MNFPSKPMPFHLRHARRGLEQLKNFSRTKLWRWTRSRRKMIWTHLMVTATKIIIIPTDSMAMMTPQIMYQTLFGSSESKSNRDTKWIFATHDLILSARLAQHFFIANKCFSHVQEPKMNDFYRYLFSFTNRKTILFFLLKQNVIE